MNLRPTAFKTRNADRIGGFTLVEFGRIAVHGDCHPGALQG